MADIHEISTNLSADERSDLLLKTYEKWIRFALGMEAIGGRMLKNPSGRYAASIIAQTTRVPAGVEEVVKGKRTVLRRRPAHEEVIAIFIDNSMDGSTEAGIIEHGHGPVDLKQKMLADHPQGRFVPIRKEPDAPVFAAAIFKNWHSVGSLQSLMTRTGARTTKRNKPTYRAVSGPIARIWSQSYSTAYKGDVRFMSPKSKGWIIPAMPAYSPAKILKDQLPTILKRRITVP